MTKQDIINDVSSSTGLTKLETEIIMNGVMSTIINSLANNERVELRGFGTFGIKHRMPKKLEIPGQENLFTCLNVTYQLSSRVN